MQINNKTSRCLRAFTLLELIVAIMLMDVIALTLYSSIYSGFKAKESSHALLGPFQSVTPAFEYMRRDITSAVRPDGILAGVFEGQDNKGKSTLDADTLSFYTCSYQTNEEEISSNIVNISYALETDYQKDELVLIRLITQNVLSPTTVTPDQEVVCRDIKGIDIKYYDGSTWLNEWDSSVYDSRLPRGMKITLTVYDENFTYSKDRLRDFTRIFILPYTNQSQQESEENGGGING